MRSNDQTIEVAIADLAKVDPDAAEAARAGFEALTWGEGLASITALGLAEFLWCQLPLKWMCDHREKQQVASAVGELFTRLGKGRYAAMCASPATSKVLTAYARDGEVAGLRAYRAALAATGVEPPDVDGLIEWGSVMGAEEAAAY